MIKKLIRLACLAGILAVALAAILSGGLPTQANNDSMEVEQTLRNLLIQKDLDHLAEFYVQDDSFSAVIVGGIALDGFDNFKDYLINWSRTGALEQRTLSNIDVYESGDVAWATAQDNWVCKYTDGRPDRPVHAIETFGLVKRNGRWLIQHFHVTESIPAHNIILGFGTGIGR